MLYNTNDKEHGRSRAGGSTGGDSRGALNTEQLRAHPLVRVTHGCSSLVSGILFISSEIDGNDELLIFLYYF